MNAPSGVPGYKQVLDRLDIQIEPAKILNPGSPPADVYAEMNLVRQAANILRAQLSVALSSLPNPTVEFRASQRQLTIEEKRSLYTFLGKWYDEDTPSLVSLKAFLKSIIETIDFLIHEEEQRFNNEAKAAREGEYDRFVDDFTTVKNFHNQCVDVLRTFRPELHLAKMEG